MDNYNDILKRMKDTYKEYAGYDVEDATDIDNRMRVLAGEIFSMQVRLDKIKKEMFVETATGAELDKHGMQRGLVRKDAVASSGVLSFSAQFDTLSYDIEVPKGTICSTSGENPIRFITDENVVIESGSESYSVNAHALTAGSNGNVASGTVTVVVTPGIANITVNNENPFTGGSDAEDDKTFRNRIIDAYKNISTGSNAAYYKKLALEHKGVYSANVVSRPDGQRGKVYIYVSGKGVLLSQDIIDEIQARIDNLREINVDVTVLSPSISYITPTVYISVQDGYSFDEVHDKVYAALSDKLSCVGIGQGVYCSEIFSIIMSVEGVKYCTTPDHMPNYYASDDTLLKASSITIMNING
ncbi:MAG: baseplate J/gp47 family protein [Acutalibacteraceae bacterium]